MSNHKKLKNNNKTSKSKLHTVLQKDIEIISKIQNRTSKYKQKYYDYKSSMS